MAKFGLEFWSFGKILQPRNEFNRHLDALVKQSDSTNMTAEDFINQIRDDDEGRKNFYAAISGSAFPRKVSVQLKSGAITIDLDPEKTLAEGSFADRLAYQIDKALACL